MRQCTLEKGNAVQVAWIDVDKSDQGRYTGIKLEDGTLDPNWHIAKVGNVLFSKEWISKRSQDHKNMKKMTDV